MSGSDRNVGGDALTVKLFIKIIYQPNMADARIKDIPNTKLGRINLSPERFPIVNRIL